MSWTFGEDAKKVRRSIYGHFLNRGGSENVSVVMAETGLSQTDVHTALEELERGLMVMLQPATHDVVKCPPWTNTPSRHAVENDGNHLCFAGCSIEAANMSYCYPGRTITIRTCCPHSAQEIVLRYKDGQILEYSPSTVVLHIGTNPLRWESDWFRACEHNNFFASAKDVRSWEEAHPELAGVTLTVQQFQQLAKYENRLDLERGADINPSIMVKFLADLGIRIPAAWR